MTSSLGKNRPRRLLTSPSRLHFLQRRSLSVTICTATGSGSEAHGAGCGVGAWPQIPRMNRPAERPPRYSFPPRRMVGLPLAPWAMDRAMEARSSSSPRGPVKHASRAAGSSLASAAQGFHPAGI